MTESGRIKTFLVNMSGFSGKRRLPIRNGHVAHVPVCLEHLVYILNAKKHPDIIAP